LNKSVYVTNGGLDEYTRAAWQPPVLKLSYGGGFRFESVYARVWNQPCILLDVGSVVSAYFEDDWRSTQ